MRDSVGRVMPSLRTLPADLRNFAKYHLVRRHVTYPAPETELGVVPIGFEMDTFLETLHGYSDRFEIDELARVSYGGRELPMLRLRSAQEGAKCHVVVLAGIHGNEQAGLLAVPEILDAYEGERGVALTVIAPANPIGADETSRYNAEGYDINRDFTRFLTPEARAIRRALQDFPRGRPDFVVSLHEGPQDATFFFANGSVPATVSANVARALADGGTELAARDYFGLTLDPPGVSASSPAARGLAWVWDKTLGMKAANRYCEERGVPEITLESSWRLADREARVRAHVDVVGAVLREMAE